jgi:anion-transporting  ArsA/GET3 family ATPase
MELLIEIPAKVEQKAVELGVDVRTLVDQAFDVIVPDVPPAGVTRLGLPRMTRAQATAAIRELQSRQTLGSTVSIKDLIEEGRRF